MTRAPKQGNVRFSRALLRAAISSITAGLLWGLLPFGRVRGQDLPPALPDLEVLKSERTPIFPPTPFTAEAAADASDRDYVPIGLDRARVMMKGNRFKEALECVNNALAWTQRIS